MTTTLKEVIIDGEEFVPKTTILPDGCLKALRELDSLIWIEACYDPMTMQTKEFAAKLYPHIRLLNEYLKFKK